MKLFLWILAGLILLGLTVLVIDNNRFIIRNYSITGAGVKRPVRIAFLTDLHENRYGRDNRALIEAVRAAEPDLILLGGDLIISAQAGKKADWFKNTASLIRGIREICPMYYVDGNHEMRLKLPGYRLIKEGRELENFLKTNGVAILHNKRADLDSGISLFGLELDQDCYRRFRLKKLSPDYIENRIGKAGEEGFNLLLTHNPDYFREYAAWGADAVLAGHIHGGIVRFPFTRQGVINPRFCLFPKYSGGRYELNLSEGNRRRTCTMILSCGLGMHSLPVRAFNPAELSIIDIVPLANE